MRDRKRCCCKVIERGYSCRQLHDDVRKSGHGMDHVNQTFSGRRYRMRRIDIKEIVPESTEEMVFEAVLGIVGIFVMMFFGYMILEIMRDAI